jgi:hypothetical protein
MEKGTDLAVGFDKLISGAEPGTDVPVDPTSGPAFASAVRQGPASRQRRTRPPPCSRTRRRVKGSTLSGGSG